MVMEKQIILYTFQKAGKCLKVILLEALKSLGSFSI